jgi:translation elongation factor Ts
MTGVGMLDCKKALEASNGDMDGAVTFLREKGLAASQKKAGRVAAEGAVAAVVNDAGVGAVVEVNSETDFVAANELFQKFVNDIACVVADQDPADLDALMALRIRTATSPCSRCCRKKSWSSEKTSKSAALSVTAAASPFPISIWAERSACS